MKYNKVITVLTVGYLSLAGFSYANANEIIEVYTANESPDAATILVDDTQNSDLYEIFTFEIDNDSDTATILEDLEIIVATPGDDPLNILNTISIEVEGVEFDSIDSRKISSFERAYTFSPNYLLEVETETTTSLLTSFKPIANGYRDGQKIRAFTHHNLIEVAPNVQDNGRAVSDTHTLRAAGLNVDEIYTELDLIEVDGSNNDQLAGEIDVEISAFETDVYFNANNFEKLFVHELRNVNTGTTYQASFSTFEIDVERNGNKYLVQEGDSASVDIALVFTGLEPGAYVLENKLIRYRNAETNQVKAVGTPGTETGIVVLTN